MNMRTKMMVGALVLSLVVSGAQRSPVLFRENFASYAPDSVISSEYAYQVGERDGSPWTVTSGCLIERDGMSATGWVGDPKSLDGDATPTCDTSGSNVFRLVTKRATYLDIKVSMRLFLRPDPATGSPFTETAETPAVDWDGVKLFLRYQNPYHLYYASVARRDGGVVLKKKCAGGPDNGGTYYDLGEGELRDHPLNVGEWQSVEASVQNEGDGVRLTLSQNGETIATAVDDGVGCAPIQAAGRTGIRGDNANFQFDDFTVSRLW